MFFRKKDEKDYSGKKYILIIALLILLVAIILGISDLLEEKEDNKVDIPSLDQILEENEASLDSYIAKNTPSVKENDRIIGDINAPLKIFVFEDYNDKFSAQFSKTVNKIIRENSGQVAAVVRPYIGATSESKSNAIALVCAYKKGNFAQTRDYIFNTLLNKENTEKVEYNTDCLTEEEKLTKTNEFRNSAETFGVYGSPTIFIGNEVIVGARPYDNYKNSEGEEIEGMNELVKNILDSNKS
ncbi:MAG: thioredoxin domain-containing protein [Patescibacteria group bacterium]|jgi:protein-disulfide isomerase|nr:thioredoxin domain-containing protein [Patescibacteria group bacterium]